jgi:hypothetical protein
MDVQEIISVIVTANPASTITLKWNTKSNSVSGTAVPTTVYTFSGSAAVTVSGFTYWIDFCGKTQ